MLSGNQIFRLDGDFSGDRSITKSSSTINMTISNLPPICWRWWIWEVACQCKNSTGDLIGPTATWWIRSRSGKWMMTIYLFFFFSANTAKKWGERLLNVFLSISTSNVAPFFPQVQITLFFFFLFSCFAIGVWVSTIVHDSCIIYSLRPTLIVLFLFSHSLRKSS